MSKSSSDQPSPMPSPISVTPAKAGVQGDGCHKPETILDSGFRRKDERTCPERREGVPGTMLEASGMAGGGTWNETWIIPFPYAVTPLHPHPVTPAKAGVQGEDRYKPATFMDSGFRRKDGRACPERREDVPGATAGSVRNGEWKDPEGNVGSSRSLTP